MAWVQVVRGEPVLTGAFDRLSVVAIVGLLSDDRGGGPAQPVRRRETYDVTDRGAGKLRPGDRHVTWEIEAQLS